MKLLTALLLTMPAFSGVIYDVNSPEGIGFTLSVPDFLTNIDPGRQSWTFSADELSRRVCVAGNYPYITCDGTYLNNYGGVVTAGMKLHDDYGDLSTAMEAHFSNASLSTAGQWKDDKDVVTLTVTQSAAAPVPEPSSVFLSLIGIGLICVKCASRLLNRTVDSVEVVASGR